MHTFVLNGIVPKVGGWTLIASCDNTPEGNIIRTVPGWPGDINILEKYRHSVACEHCTWTRNRKSTFILVDEDENWKQVGRSCLSQFLGANCDNEVSFMDVCAGLCDALKKKDSEYQTAPTSEWNLDLKDVLAATMAISAVKGYRPARLADEANPSTAGLVMEWMTGRDFRADRLRSQCPLTLPEAVDAKITTVIEWALTLGNASDYEHNLFVIAKLGYVNLAQKHLGFAVSMIAAYDRAQRKAAGEPEPAQQQKAQRQPSRHVGKVGERHDFGACQVLFAFDSPFSTGDPGTLIILQDRDGNKLKWQASGDPGLEKGDILLTFIALVKYHGYYKGEQQTQVNRAKFTKEGESK
jgi:hypothetical protein